MNYSFYLLHNFGCTGIKITYVVRQKMLIHHHTNVYCKNPKSQTDSDYIGPQK